MSEENYLRGMYEAGDLINLQGDGEQIMVQALDDLDLSVLAEDFLKEHKLYTKVRNLVDESLRHEYVDEDSGRMIYVTCALGIGSMAAYFDRDYPMANIPDFLTYLINGGHVQCVESYTIAVTDTIRFLQRVVDQHFTPTEETPEDSKIIT